MFAPEITIATAIAPKKPENADRIEQAIARYAGEDPTFCTREDCETEETLIFGTSDRHLETYIQRIERECDAELAVGDWKVQYRETPTQPAAFERRFIRQTSCLDHYGHVIGHIYPAAEAFAFESRVAGCDIPEEFLPACAEGFSEAAEKGTLAGYPVLGVKVILESGSYDEYMSRPFSFKIAAHGGFRQGFSNTNPILLEPFVGVEVKAPRQFAGQIQSNLLTRRGEGVEVEVSGEGCLVLAEVPLQAILGYGEYLRSHFGERADFSMHLAGYRQVSASRQEKLIAEAAEREKGN